MSTEPKPTIGRIVHYHPTLDDIVRWTDKSGGELPDNAPREGAPLAAICTSDAFDDVEQRVNLTVFADGELVARAWSAPKGEPDKPGTWCYPPRVA